MEYLDKSKTFEIKYYNQELVDKIARDWVYKSADVQKGQNIIIIADMEGYQLALAVAKLCGDLDCNVNYRIKDLELDSALFERMSEKNVLRYYAYLNPQIHNSDVVFMIRAAKGHEFLKNVPQKNLKAFSDAQKPILLDYRVRHTNWQLIYWPTQAEADMENMTLEEYSQMFFEACNQDWDAISKAQQIIIDKLEQGNILELKANSDDPDPKRRTHVTMSIKGQQFVNSDIDNNYPGSEVFSSPVRESVNGQVFRMGKCPLGHENKIVEDVYLRFENGKIVEFDSKQNKESLTEFLNRDEGAKYIGEIAIGTNPGLRQQVYNGLLNEKVGGSFHITPGQAYQPMYNKNRDMIVNTYNGNESAIHWDLTIMMLPKYGGGEIILDGEILQKDGKFVLPGTEVLNAGLE